MGALLFWVLGALALLGGIGVIAFGRRESHAALSLGLVIVALAGLYTWLAAPFLSIAQILGYSGVVLLFWTLGMAKLERSRASSEGDPQPSLKLIGAALLALLALKAGTLLALLYASWPELPADYGSARRLGELLYTQYLLAVYLVGGIVLAGVVASVLLAKRGLD